MKVEELMANVAAPAVFAVGDPPEWLRTLSIALLEIPRGELITTGPFALMKHP
jgi:hypothetical protein